MNIDIAIPSYGDTQLEKCLLCLYKSINNSKFSINTIYFDFKIDNDGSNTLLVKDFCDKYNISWNISISDRNLPESREYLINKITTKWFLFVDGDVMVQKDIMKNMYKTIASTIGGIQSRRVNDTDPNWKWSYRRAVRGTMFCSLIRKKAVTDIEIPQDMTVLEDEYIRQYVEENNYLWVFNHQAKFKHESEQRHKIDFTEGKIAGKYGLLPYDYIFLHIPYAIATGRSPIRFVKRAIGYMYAQVI